MGTPDSLSGSFLLAGVPGNNKGDALSDKSIDQSPHVPTIKENSR